MDSRQNKNSKKLIVALPVILAMLALYLLVKQVPVVDKPVAAQTTPLPVEALPTVLTTDDGTQALNAPQISSVKPVKACLGSRHFPKLSSLRRNFVLSHAVIWYLDGEDKSQIAQALAAQFDMPLAKEFSAYVGKISRSAEDTAQLYQHLKHAQSNLTEPAIWKDFSLFHDPRRRQKITNLTFDQATTAAGQSPDIAKAIWQRHFGEALYDKKTFDDILRIFDKVQQLPEDTPFEEQLFKSVGRSLLMSKKSSDFKHRLFELMVDTQTIYYDPNDSDAEGIALILDTLKNHGFDTAKLTLRDINTLDNTPESRLLSKLEALQKNYPPSLQSIPVQPICDDNQQIIEVKRKEFSVTEINADEALSPWLKGAACASVFYQRKPLSYYAMLNRLRHEFNLTSSSLNKLEFIKYLDFQAVEQLISTLEPELQNQVYFALLPTGAKPAVKFEIASRLIDKGFYPKDATAMHLLRGLPDDKAEMLFRRMQDLAPYTALGVGIPLMTYSQKQWQLTFQLLNEGYGLVDPDSPYMDPLTAMLDYYAPRQIEPHFSNLLAKVIEQNGPLQPHQVNRVYQIKLQNPEIFEKLIAKHPELFPYEPEQLVTVRCE